MGRVDELEQRLEMAITHIHTLGCLLIDCCELLKADGTIDDRVWRELMIAALKGNPELYKMCQNHPEGKRVEKQVRAMLEARMREAA